jgi:hypothetical protein
MIKEIVVRHHEYISTKPFEDVVAAFEAAVGTLEDIGWDSIPASSKDAAQFEAKVKERIGSSGFTRFLTIDHGRWLTMIWPTHEDADVHDWKSTDRNHDASSRCWCWPQRSRASRHLLGRENRFDPLRL